MKQVADMRKKSLLDDFKRLALDVEVWDTVVPEHWYVVFHSIDFGILILGYRVP